MKKKLLELCLSPDLGGLELYMVRASKALSDDFDVISVINRDGKLQQYYENTIHRYEKIVKKSNLFMLLAAKKLADIIDENAIEIVHLHWTKDLPIAVLAKQLSKQKPKLVQTRNMTMTRFKDDFYHRFLYENLDLMLPVTYQVESQIKRFIPEAIRPKVETLYMGSDKPKLLDADALEKLRHELGMSHTFSVGMVGRIEEAKGQHILIDAVADLERKGINVKAYFVGHAMEESYMDTLQENVLERAIDEYIHFLGFMKNPHHFMQACDAIVLATECETFGLVLTEAMQAETAVIATNACGPLEIIDEGRTGLLFERDDVSTLSKCINQLRENPDLLKKMEIEGAQKAHDVFSSDTQFVKLSEVLKRVV